MTTLVGIVMDDDFNPSGIGAISNDIPGNAPPQPWPVALPRWASSAPPDRAWPPHPPRSRAPAPLADRFWMGLIIGMLIVFCDFEMIVDSCSWYFIMFEDCLMMLKHDLMICQDLMILEDCWWFLRMNSWIQNRYVTYQKWHCSQ